MLAVTGMLGPMARDVDSLALCMKALLCQQMFQLDPSVPPIPFDEEVRLRGAPMSPSAQQQRTISGDSHLVSCAEIAKDPGKHTSLWTGDTQHE